MNDQSDNWPAPPPPPQPLTPQQPMQGQIYQQPYQAFGQPYTVDTGAILALTLAILSWIFIPVIGAIAALAIAPSARRRIHQSGGTLGTTQMVTAAQIIASLNLLAVLVLGLLIVLLITLIF